MPRLRSGFELDNIGATVTHFLSSEAISCEAVLNTEFLAPVFDSIGWFTSDLVYLGFPFNKLPIANSLSNFTTTFDARSPFVKENKIYKCCTMLKSDIIDCQQFLAYFNVTQPATARLPLSIAKQINAITVSTLQADYADVPTKSSGGRLSDTEIAIIVACTAGTIILSLLTILCLMCYKRHRYGAVCLHSSMKNGIQLQQQQQLANKTFKSKKKMRQAQMSKKKHSLYSFLFFSIYLY